MPRNSFRLSSKLLFRQFIVAVVKASLDATPTSVARKSSDSSSSAGFIEAKPPSRTIRAVIAARPGTPTGSSDAPPLNVIERFTSGNSRDGAKKTIVPSGSTRRNVLATGGSNASGANSIPSGRGGIPVAASCAATATGAAVSGSGFGAGTFETTAAAAGCAMASPAG